MPQYRIWEFLLGVFAYALLALSPRLTAPPIRLFPGSSVPLSNILSVLLLAVIFSDQGMLSQKTAVLATCTMTSAIIIINSPGRMCGGRHTEVLSNKFLGIIGDASYSIYLVHWPVIVIFEWVVGFETVAGYPACILLIVVASLTIWKYVEPRKNFMGAYRYGLVLAASVMVVAMIADRPYVFCGDGGLGWIFSPGCRFFLWSAPPHSLHNEWWRLYEADGAAGSPCRCKPDAIALVSLLRSRYSFSNNLPWFMERSR